MSVRIKVKLCPDCERKLAAWRNKFGERSMAAIVGQTLQACVECRQQLPQTDGHMFTKLKQDFEADFEENPKGRP